jgi:hypothetical protein
MALTKTVVARPNRRMARHDIPIVTRHMADKGRRMPDGAGDHSCQFS